MLRDLEKLGVYIIGAGTLARLELGCDGELGPGSGRIWVEDSCKIIDDFTSHSDTPPHSDEC